MALVLTPHEKKFRQFRKKFLPIKSAHNTRRSGWWGGGRVGPSTHRAGASRRNHSWNPTPRGCGLLSKREAWAGHFKKIQTLNVCLFLQFLDDGVLRVDLHGLLRNHVRGRGGSDRNPTINLVSKGKLDVRQIFVNETFERANQLWQGQGFPPRAFQRGRVSGDNQMNFFSFYPKKFFVPVSTLPGRGCPPQSPSLAG